MALLKVEPKGDLRPVQFLMRGTFESGEGVTVIGNPEVSDGTLINSLAGGVISNPRREIEGRPYVQTSATIASGHRGAPMFNTRGQMIGVVVANTSIESTGFAIPMETVLKFLKAGVKPGDVANPAEAPPIVQKKPESRIWTDVSGKQVTATLVGVKEGKAVLRKPDGQEISVPVGHFSDVDQDIIKRSQQ